MMAVSLLPLRFSVYITCKTVEASSFILLPSSHPQYVPATVVKKWGYVLPVEEYFRGIIIYEVFD